MNTLRLDSIASTSSEPEIIYQFRLKVLEVPDQLVFDAKYDRYLGDIQYAQDMVQGSPYTYKRGFDLEYDSKITISGPVKHPDGTYGTYFELSATVDIDHGVWLKNYVLGIPANPTGWTEIASDVTYGFLMPEGWFSHVAGTAPTVEAGNPEKTTKVKVSIIPVESSDPNAGTIRFDPAVLPGSDEISADKETASATGIYTSSVAGMSVTMAGKAESEANYPLGCINWSGLGEVISDLGEGNLVGAAVSAFSMVVNPQGETKLELGTCTGTWTFKKQVRKIKRFSASDTEIAHDEVLVDWADMAD